MEKRGTFTNGKGRVQKFMKALEPRGDARPEWEFLHELVFNVTGQDGYATIEGLFNLMAKEVPAFNGLTWAGLGDTGVTVPDLINHGAGFDSIILEFDQMRLVRRS